MEEKRRWRCREVRMGRWDVEGEVRDWGIDEQLGGDCRWKLQAQGGRRRKRSLEHEGEVLVDDLAGWPVIKAG